MYRKTALRRPGQKGRPVSKRARTGLQRNQIPLMQGQYAPKPKMFVLPQDSLGLRLFDSFALVSPFVYSFSVLGAAHDISGSAQELVETRILGGFLKNDKFGLGDGHALGFEQ